MPRTAAQAEGPGEVFDDLIHLFPRPFCAAGVVGRVGIVYRLLELSHASLELATCAIVKRAVVGRGPNGEDTLSIRPVCFLPLSYDHRLIDGADAARFLQDVKKRIEEGNFESDLGL